MIRFFCIYILFSYSLYAQTVVPLSRVTLSEVSKENRPLLFQSSKFKLFLTNSFCDENKSMVNLTKKEIAQNLEYYQAELPQLLSSFETLINELEPGFFVDNPEIYPIEISLSLDGNESCYNATAVGNEIELPAQSDPEYMEAVFALIYHEIGHALSAYNGNDQNIFDETIADAISLLLYDPQGVFYLNAKTERDNWRRQIDLGLKDPHALASELEIEYTTVPSWLKENRLKYKCTSDNYYRDISNSVPLSDIMKGGGESYIVSCAFHSYLNKLGLSFGREEVLKIFVKTYLQTPQIFNELDIPVLLEKVFPLISHRSYDSTFEQLALKSVNEKITLSLSSFQNQEGPHYQLSWDHEDLIRDWGVVAFKDNDGKSLVSFSLIHGNNSALLTPQDVETCRESSLVCFCPDSKNQIELQLAWMTRTGTRTQEKVLKLPLNPSGCFEIGLSENLKTHK